MHLCPQTLKDRVRALEEEAQLSSDTLLSTRSFAQVMRVHARICICLYAYGHVSIYAYG